MKKLFILAIFLPFSINAAVLNFDDLNIGGNGTYEQITDLNYGGFVWDSRWGVGSTDELNYDTSASSGKQYLSNYNGVNNLTVTSGTAFTFDGAYFGHPNRNSNIASWVSISAYDSLNQLIGSTGQVSLSSVMMWVSAGFEDVYKLVFTVDSKWFTMDDFTYNEVSEVPIPAAAFLFGPALLGFMGLRRKAKQAA